MSDPSKAFMALNLCNKWQNARTVEVHLVNDTPYEVELWLYQLLDTIGRPNNEFIENTGVVVGKVNGQPNQRYISDPCYAGGEQHPIQGNVAKSSFKIRGAPNHVDLPDQTAAPNQYWLRAGWRIYIGSYRPDGSADISSLKVESLFATKEKSSK